MKELLKAIGEVIKLLLTGKSNEAVDAGICDYSGEGRDEYGT